MKKIVTISIILTLSIFLTGCSIDSLFNKTNEEPQSNQEEKSDEEKFNDSGRAKAIEDETDLWQLYDNSEVDFSFQYPHDVTLINTSEKITNLEQTYISVRLKDIGTKENPMDLDAEEEMATIEALHSGEFGENHDFVLDASKDVRSVGFLFAQDLAVLSRFEVCNVTLERKLVFYFNNKEITITLYGPTDTLKETMPEYFTANSENCRDETVWNLDMQEEFYNELVDANGSEEIQRWYDYFDQIAETITFAHR